MTVDEGLMGQDLASLAHALDFYRHSGIDWSLDPEPCNRFLASAPSEITTNPPIMRALSPLDARSAPDSAPRSRAALNSHAGDIAASAQELAQSSHSLEELRTKLEAFDGCALKTTATQLVFADGAANARIMFVGEAPGADEDREGRPFVGRAGQLLDQMLGAIQLDRKSVYISNVVPWRPPGNRTPTPLEVAACLPFTLRQIELVRPDFLICLGAASMQALLNVKEGILKTRGRWRSLPIGGQETPCMAMLHPAYLLRQPLQKRLAWRDFRALKKAQHDKNLEREKNGEGSKKE